MSTRRAITLFLMKLVSLSSPFVAQPGVSSFEYLTSDSFAASFSSLSSFSSFSLKSSLSRLNTSQIMVSSCPKVFSFQPMLERSQFLRSQVTIQNSLSKTLIILRPILWMLTCLISMELRSSSREQSFLRLRSSSTAQLSVSTKSSILLELMKLRLCISFWKWPRSFSVACSTLRSSVVIMRRLRTPSCDLMAMNLSQQICSSWKAILVGLLPSMICLHRSSSDLRLLLNSSLHRRCSSRKPNLFSGSPFDLQMSSTSPNSLQSASRACSSSVVWNSSKAACILSLSSSSLFWMLLSFSPTSKFSSCVRYSQALPFWLRVSSVLARSLRQAGKLPWAKSSLRKSSMSASMALQKGSIPSRISASHSLMSRYSQLETMSLMPRVQALKRSNLSMQLGMKRQWFFSCRQGTSRCLNSKNGAFSFSFSSFRSRFTENCTCSPMLPIFPYDSILLQFSLIRRSVSSLIWLNLNSIECSPAITPPRYWMNSLPMDSAISIPSASSTICEHCSTTVVAFLMFSRLRQISSFLLLLRASMQALRISTFSRSLRAMLSLAKAQSSARLSSRFSTFMSSSIWRFLLLSSSLSMLALPSTSSLSVSRRSSRSRMIRLHRASTLRSSPASRPRTSALFSRKFSPSMARTRSIFTFVSLTTFSDSRASSFVMLSDMLARQASTSSVRVALRSLRRWARLLMADFCASCVLKAARLLSNFRFSPISAQFLLLSCPATSMCTSLKDCSITFSTFPSRSLSISAEKDFAAVMVSAVTSARLLNWSSSRSFRSCTISSILLAEITCRSSKSLKRASSSMILALELSSLALRAGLSLELMASVTISSKKVSSFSDSSCTKWESSWQQPLILSLLCRMFMIFSIIRRWNCAMRYLRATNSSRTFARSPCANFSISRFVESVNSYWKLFRTSVIGGMRQSPLKSSLQSLVSGSMKFSSSRERSRISLRKVVSLWLVFSISVRYLSLLSIMLGTSATLLAGTLLKQMAMLSVTVSSWKRLEMISLILIAPAIRSPISESQGRITTTRTDRAPCSALIIPTPFAMSTSTPALSPNPGLSQITSVFLLSGRFFLYMQSGTDTALMQRVQDLASGEVQKVLWSLCSSPVGTSVVSLPYLPSLRPQPRNFRMLVDLPLPVLPIMNSTSLSSISCRASLVLLIRRSSSSTLIEKIFVFSAHSTSQASSVAAFLNSSSISAGREDDSYMYLPSSPLMSLCLDCPSSRSTTLLPTLFFCTCARMISRCSSFSSDPSGSSLQSATRSRSCSSTLLSGLQATCSGYGSLKNTCSSSLARPSAIFSAMSLMSSSPCTAPMTAQQALSKLGRSDPPKLYPTKTSPTLLRFSLFSLLPLGLMWISKVSKSLNCSQRRIILMPRVRLVSGSARRASTRVAITLGGRPQSSQRYQTNSLRWVDSLESFSRRASTISSPLAIACVFSKLQRILMKLLRKTCLDIFYLQQVQKLLRLILSLLASTCNISKKKYYLFLMFPDIVFIQAHCSRNMQSISCTIFQSQFNLLFPQYSQSEKLFLTLRKIPRLNSYSLLNPQTSLPSFHP